ncbi:ATPase AAA [Bacteroidia bacterium]|nr:ATPase AAA [Bacteroidia bacterium]
MKQLFPPFHRKLEQADDTFERYLTQAINWSNRLIAIVGARGSGKTTLLLQHIKKEYGTHPEDILYVSLDTIWFSDNRLYDLANQFSLMGGKVLFLDEVHKYPTWSREIKNIYDDFPELKVVFTGSSMLEIFRADADLSRRARRYVLQGMSFREYLIYEGLLKKDQTAYTLEDILNNHLALSQEICKKIKPLPAFKKYLQYGYYPYYKEDVAGYHERLMQTFNTIIETDLPSVEKIEMSSINRIKKLFFILSSLVPFTPNIAQLSQDVGVTRVSLMNYLYYLEKANAVLLLNKEASGMRQMQKPDKIYLQNTNYAYALASENVNIGNLRETFFFNQLQVKHQVTYTQETDFKIDNKYYFEIGGKNKGREQIQGLQNAFLALDDIETGLKNDIPLWLFGFLY